MAGWGRNLEALQALIDELAGLGQGLKIVPEFYPLSVDRLSQGYVIKFSGENNCGEVEFFLGHTGEDLLVGLGLDFIDLALEA